MQGHESFFQFAVLFIFALRKVKFFLTLSLTLSDQQKFVYLLLMNSFDLSSLEASLRGFTLSLGTIFAFDKLRGLAYRCQDCKITHTVTVANQPCGCSWIYIGSFWTQRLYVAFDGPLCFLSIDCKASLSIIVLLSLHRGSTLSIGIWKAPCGFLRLYTVGLSLAVSTCSCFHALALYIFVKDGKVVPYSCLSSSNCVVHTCFCTYEGRMYFVLPGWLIWNLPFRHFPILFACCGNKDIHLSIH
jgi:hypothetical protein